MGIIERQIPYELTYMWNLKTNNKKKLTDREQTGGNQGRRGWGVGEMGSKGTSFQV